MVDPEARKQTVREELARIERETGLRARPDEALVAEVIHLGEYPVGVVGGFDPSFLEIPEEMIVTTMRNNQRYFALESADGKLANKFVTMMATIVADPEVVRRGNEKVIASRLSDGKFFFAEDRKKSLDAWNTKLDSVVFQAKLGDGRKTIGDKVRRIVKIVEALGGDGHAASICKADLASHAVGEFPELQGVMGRYYAKHFGYGDDVARAVEEHWWPKGGGGDVPTTPNGALVALADRMDTIVGCFAVGLEPSGSADPLGLRRAAIGVWQILLKHPTFSFTQLLDAAKAALGVAEVKLDEFFRQRLRGIFVDSGIPAQDADAALAQDFRDPRDAMARALACAKISKEAREVFKRVANIVDDARGKGLVIGDAPTPARFVADVERTLHAAIAAAQQREDSARTNRNYAAVFESLEALRPTVAMFFDKGGVMVMDPDPALRDNRLALLHWFITPYLSIADFRLLGGSGGAS
ncbi:MAG: glycine--tRNA ligase subunit beta [Proteobacteria bacterium]|nr:glycine--tRNA ligase subunit beta [Pseudomonadota bacterium]